MLYSPHQHAITTNPDHQHWTKNRRWTLKSSLGSRVHLHRVRVRSVVQRMLRDSDGALRAERHGDGVREAVLLRREHARPPGVPHAPPPGSLVPPHAVRALVHDIQIPGLRKVQPQWADQTVLRSLTQSPQVLAILVEGVEAALDSVGHVRDAMFVVTRDVGRLPEGEARLEFALADGLPRVLTVHSNLQTHNVQNCNLDGHFSMKVNEKSSGEILQVKILFVVDGSWAGKRNTAALFGDELIEMLNVQTPNSPHGFSLSLSLSLSHRRHFPLITTSHFSIFGHALPCLTSLLTVVWVRCSATTSWSAASTPSPVMLANSAAPRRPRSGGHTSSCSPRALK